ncbi:MAG: hypothetical protein J7J30_06025, partial [Candidatus Odinarchaeota archaeon]|nr:hypothetical protein [Candidatus Odinarchaeota archaeon]
FIVLNNLNETTLNPTEIKNWIQKILNTIREKPEILLNDVNFKSLSFPLAGKIKIPYINNSPAQVKINAIIFNSNLHNAKGNAFFVQNYEEFSKALKEIETLQHEANYIDFSNIQKTTVRFFTILSAIWSLAFMFSYLNLLQPVTLTAIIFSFVASFFLFTAIKVRKTFTEMKAKLFYQSEDIKLHAQPFTPSDIISCFNTVVEAFLNKNWLKFNSSAKHLLSTLSNRINMNAEIYNKINMLNEILSIDISLRNESAHFFVLNELSKILKSLNLVNIDVKEVLKEKEETEVAETETTQENNEQEEILEEIHQSTTFSKTQENSGKTFKTSENEKVLANFDAKESMGVIFHPLISSVNDFLETFEKRTEETVIGEGEERG